jgi:hypothetical protein
MSNESFLIRTKGGPYDGETRVVSLGVLPWPPPVNLPGVFHGGVYMRTNFSRLPDMSMNSKVMRGADYEWVAYKKGEDVFAT